MSFNKIISILVLLILLGTVVVAVNDSLKGKTIDDRLNNSESSFHKFSLNDYSYSQVRSEKFREDFKQAHIYCVLSEWNPVYCGLDRGVN